MQVVDGLLHVLEKGSELAQAPAIRTLYFLCGVQLTVLQSVAESGGVEILTRRSWHGTAEVQVCT